MVDRVERQERQRDQARPDVPDHEEERDRDGRPQVGQDRDGLPGDEGLDRPHVVHQAADDGTGRGPVVVIEAEPLETGVEPVTQVADDAQADTADDRLLARPAPAWAANTYEQAQGRTGRSHHRSPLDDAVDQPLHQKRDRQIQQTGQARQRQRARRRER